MKKRKNELYNQSIAYYLIGNQTSSISNLSQAIRLDINYFQLHHFRKPIYRNNDNKNNADKVRDRMETAEAKLIKKEQKNLNKDLNLKNHKISSLLKEFNQI